VSNEPGERKAPRLERALQWARFARKKTKETHMDEMLRETDETS
jgi:hypothetical protein